MLSSSPNFKRVLRVITPGIDKENTVGYTAKCFFCISSYSFCCGTHKLLPSDSLFGKWQALTFEFLISPICFIDIQANLPNFSLWTSWQVPFSLWLGSTPGSQTCQVIYWIRESYCWLSPCVTQQPCWHITHFQHCPASALQPSLALNWWCRAGDRAGCCSWCDATWQDVVLGRAVLNGLLFPSAAAEIKTPSLHAQLWPSISPEEE